MAAARAQSRQQPPVRLLHPPSPPSRSPRSQRRSHGGRELTRLRRAYDGVGDWGVRECIDEGAVEAGRGRRGVVSARGAALPWKKKEQHQGGVIRKSCGLVRESPSTFSSTHWSASSSTDLINSNPGAMHLMLDLWFMLQTDAYRNCYGSPKK